MAAQGWPDPFRAAVLAALESPDASRHLAETLAPYLAEKLQARGNDDGWLDVRGAAAYLGMSPAQIHKLTSARLVPFSQEGRAVSAGSSAPTSTSGCRWRPTRTSGMTETGGTGAPPPGAAHVHLRYPSDDPAI